MVDFPEPFSPTSTVSPAGRFRSSRRTWATAGTVAGHAEASAGLAGSCRISRNARPSSSHFIPLQELRERQGVAAWIGEPCDLLAPGGCPDAVFVLVHAVVPVEHDAFGREAPDRGLDISDPPAKHGVAGPRDCRDRCHAQHGAVRVKYAREVVLLDRKSVVQGPLSRATWCRSRQIRTRSRSARPPSGRASAHRTLALVAGRPPRRRRLHRWTPTCHLPVLLTAWRPPWPQLNLAAGKHALLPGWCGRGCRWVRVLMVSPGLTGRTR